LGLGLYLAHRIATALQGELTIDSPPGRGASFKLRLPLYDDEPRSGARRTVPNEIIQR
jgi:signal transduction histidine kinase